MALWEVEEVSCLLTYFLLLMLLTAGIIHLNIVADTMAERNTPAKKVRLPIIIPPPGKGSILECGALKV